MSKCRYFVMKGRQNTPGTDICEYAFFDVIEVDDSKSVNNQFRKYAYRKFYEMGASATSMRDDTFIYQKNIPLYTTENLLPLVTVVKHSHTFFMFISVDELYNAVYSVDITQNKIKYDKRYKQKIKVEDSVQENSVIDSA